MSTGTDNPVESLSFELEDAVTSDGRLDLLRHYRNGQKLKSIRDYDLLIRKVTEYVEGLTEAVKKVKIVSVYDFSSIQPDAVPVHLGDYTVTQEYINYHFGPEVKRKILTDAGNFRTRVSYSRGIEIQIEELRKKAKREPEEFQKKSYEEKISNLEKDLQNVKLNRFTELLGPPEMNVFLNPGKPS